MVFSLTLPPYMNDFPTSLEYTSAFHRTNLLIHNTSSVAFDFVSVFHLPGVRPKKP